MAFPSLSFPRCVLLFFCQLQPTRTDVIGRSGPLRLREPVVRIPKARVVEYGGLLLPVARTRVISVAVFLPSFGRPPFLYGNCGETAFGVRRLCTGRRIGSRLADLGRIATSHRSYTPRAGHVSRRQVRNGGDLFQRQYSSEATSSSLFLSFAVSVHSSISYDPRGRSYRLSAGGILLVHKKTIRQVRVTDGRPRLVVTTGSITLSFSRGLAEGKTQISDWRWLISVFRFLLISMSVLERN